MWSWVFAPFWLQWKTILKGWIGPGMRDLHWYMCWGGFDFAFEWRFHLWSTWKCDHDIAFFGTLAQMLLLCLLSGQSWAILVYMYCFYFKLILLVSTHFWWLIWSGYVLMDQLNCALSCGQFRPINSSFCPSFLLAGFWFCIVVLKYLNIFFLPTL